MLKAMLSSTQHFQESDAVLQSLRVVSQKVIFGNNQLQYISPFCQFSHSVQSAKQPSFEYHTIYS